MINKLAKEIHQIAKSKGFYDKDLIDGIPLETNIAKWISLMHSELSEGLEAVRHKIPEGEKGCLSEEFADCIIRILDTSYYLNLDIESAIYKKINKNKNRDYLHGGKTF